MGDKPIIRIAVPGETAEDFMQAAAKQFRGDFFVAIDQPVGKFVRIEAPFLNGDVGVRGDAIAMPAVRNGRKGLVIRLVKLDADSLGIPIQEQTKELSLDAPDDDDDAAGEFESGQATVASNVSAAVAKSIRSAGGVSDRAQPVKLQAPIPEPVAKSPSQPTKLDELDAETREAVDEFSDVSTKASEISDELARKLTERSVPPATTVTPGVVHTVRRTPERGVAINDEVHSKETAQFAAIDEQRSNLDKDPRRHSRPTAQLSALVPDEPEPEAAAEAEDEELAAAAPPPKASRAASVTLVILILLTLGAAAYVVMTEL